MKLSRILPAIAGMLLLSACGYNSMEIQGIRAANPTGGTAFTRALVKEYQAAVEEEINVEYEWHHASLIAGKGLQAANGVAVLPWGQENWPSPAGAVATMNSERDRLVKVLDAGARNSKPEIAARAQVMYDCWLEETWEGQDDGVCKAAYMKAMDQLGQPMHMAKSFQVFFDLNKTVITADAAKTIADAAAEAKKMGAKRIDVIGHADNSGPKGSKYNMDLSVKRADAVKAALVKHGIDAKVVTVAAKGDTAPQVATPANTREARNRFVDIVLP